MWRMFACVPSIITHIVLLAILVVLFAPYSVYVTGGRWRLDGLSLT